MIPTVENLQKIRDEKLQQIQPYKKISNNFVESAILKNNATPLKIIYYIASKIKELNFENNFNTIQLDLKEMLEYTNLTRQNIRDNIKRMQQTSITFVDEENNIESGINLLPEYHFYWNKNYVNIVLNSKIAKLIIDVTNKYTFLNTKELVKLKNKNSIRLLPVLHMINGFNANKYKTYSINELNALFGTNYKTFGELERSVFRKVKQELDNNSSLTFTYEFNFENLGGRGRPKATSITIIPIQKTNHQTSIFTNFEIIDTNRAEEKITINETSKIEETYEERLRKFKIDEDELIAHFGIAQTKDANLINDFELYLMDKLEEFKKVFAVDRNFKDLDISFKKFIQ